MTTPAEAALAAALRQIEATRKGGEYPHLGGGNQNRLAAAILAAEPRLTLADAVPDAERQITLLQDIAADNEAEIARLRAAVALVVRRLASPLPPNRTEAVILLQRVLTPEVSDEDAIARAALAASEPDLPLGMEDL